MGSRWFYMTAEGEAGPVTFGEMVEMVRAGKLRAEDRVRGEMSTRWIHASDVVGLFQTAARSSARHAVETGRGGAEAEWAGPPSRSDIHPARVSAGAGSAWRRRAGLWAALAAVAAVGVTVVLVGWWSSRSLTFPPPRLGKVPDPSRPAIEALRAPRPSRPTLPSLPEGSPRLVPGLEKWAPAFSPCLSPDLCTIVFSATGNPGTGYDLYLASRSKVEEAFDPPKLIRSCVSPETDAYPALSPDGLELIFVRSDSSPQFLRARRRSLDEEFGTPNLWSPIQYDPGRKQRVERPQWLDCYRVMFCFVDLAGQRRQFMVAQLLQDQGGFAKVEAMPFSNPWPMYFVAPSALRAYYGSAEGVFLAARSHGQSSFGEGEVLLGSRLTGPIDGPLWVAPGEDVIVYCSPGPGKELGSGRHLWVIRY